MKKDFLLNWPEAFSSGARMAGGKGWNLGRLHRYGIKIPRGLVLSTYGYEIFIKENGLSEFIQITEGWIDQTETDNVEVETQLANLRRKIAESPFPQQIAEELFTSLAEQGILDKPLAVRSSASAEDSLAASFAGIHSSYLNVVGKEGIIEAVKNCYASLWTTTGVAYRRKKKIADSEVMQAVVIMELVKAESAGIAFTCEPSTGRGDVIIINANFGLGEAVVSGLVEPDQYELTDTYQPVLVKKKIGQKQKKSTPDLKEGIKYVQLTEEEQSEQVLTEQNIFKLTLLIQRIFEALGDSELHQDIEWVFDGREFIIVQTRPVTSLPRYTYPEIKDQPDFWSNANFKDSMPMPLATLSYKATRDTATAILTATFKAVGYPVLPGLKFAKIYQGRGYFNLALLQWLYSDALGIPPAVTNQTLGGYQPEISLENVAKRGSAKKGLYLIRLLFTLIKSARTADRWFEKTRCTCEKWLKTDLKALSDQQILALLIDMAQVSTGSVPLSAHLNNSAGVWVSKLSDTLSKYFPGRGTALANTLLLGQSSLTSAQQGYQLMMLAEVARNDLPAYEFFTSQAFDPLTWETLPENSLFMRSFREFLAKFGHRAVYEANIMNPRWREDPSYLLEIIKDFISLSSYQDFKVKQKARNEEAWKEINQSLSFVNRRLVKWLVTRAVKASEMREMAKSEVIRFLSPFRYTYLEIGQRLTGRHILRDKTDIFHATWSEVKSLLTGDWDGKELCCIVEERKELRRQWEELAAPDIIEDESPQFVPVPSTEVLAGSRIGVGIGASAGKASGIVRLISTPDEGQRLNAGDVLVAPSTDPGWTPLFLKASAIIVESGGYLSHGAIVAREYGIPAVINVPNAMSNLKDGTRVLVDGDAGVVSLLSAECEG